VEPGALELVEAVTARDFGGGGGDGGVDVGVGGVAAGEDEEVAGSFAQRRIGQLAGGVADGRDDRQLALETPRGGRPVRESQQVSGDAAAAGRSNGRRPHAVAVARGVKNVVRKGDRRRGGAPVPED